MTRAVTTALLLAAAMSSGCSGRDSDLPREYRHIAVPPDVLTSPDARARGQRLFVASCAICHGERGDGRGPRREGLAVPPRDFSNPDWRAVTTPRHVFFAIREGVAGTAMPEWKSLSDRDAWDLTAYVLSLGNAK